MLLSSSGLRGLHSVLAASILHVQEILKGSCNTILNPSEADKKREDWIIFKMHYLKEWETMLRVLKWKKQQEDCTKKDSFLLHHIKQIIFLSSKLKKKVKVYTACGKLFACDYNCKDMLLLLVKDCTEHIPWINCRKLMKVNL